MGFFNPITYFFKHFIRIFIKKFFWIILFCMFLFLGFIIFNNSGVFAVDYVASQLDLNYFNSSDSTVAASRIGNVWNNPDYDVFLVYQAGTGTKCVVYWKPTLNGKLYYSIEYDASQGLVNGYNWYWLRLKSRSNDFNFSVEDIKVYSLPNNYTELNRSNQSSTTQVSPYFLFSPSNNPGSVYCKPIRTHFDIYNTEGTKLFSATNPLEQEPYFITTDNELETFNFDYLQISGGNMPYYTEISSGVGGNATLSLKYIYSGVQTNIDLSNYITVNSDNTWSVNIPYNVLTNNVIVRNGQEFSYVFTYTPFYGSQHIVSKLNLTYNLTSEEEQQINEDSEKQLQSDILHQQEETNNKLDNLDSTINNTNVDDITSDTLPSDNTQDITSDGVNGIFTSIYNAFCTGNAQDIVFPIPFTNKNITLQANYVNNMLSSNGASWIVTIIQAFWWYLISRFIIKDVMDKINKIKSGNIEDIETSNIRGDML